VAPLLISLEVPLAFHGQLIEIDVVYGQAIWKLAVWSIRTAGGWKH
jgi:hypothetical protein